MQHHRTHNRSRFRRKLKHWLRDGRYRDQRKYVLFGVLTVLIGFFVSRLALEIGTLDWIIIGVVVIVLIIVYLVWIEQNDQ